MSNDATRFSVEDQEWPMRTFGIEEELLLVDPRNGRPLPLAEELLDLDRSVGLDRGFTLTAELQCEQIESVTAVYESLADLDKAIRAGRFHADSLARLVGARVVALGTSPMPVAPHTTAKPRYSAIAARFGLTAFEQLTCGCHVHVAVSSDEEAVGVLDRIRVWLPVLLALSANSPYWNGVDTGFASYRRRVWKRMPAVGPTEIFGSADNYWRNIDDLLGTGVLLDAGMIYFDARLSNQHPTVEIRVADVCLDSEVAVLLAALGRALVETAARQWSAGEPPPPVSVTLLQLASWEASKSGVSGELLLPTTSRPSRAAGVVMALFDHVRDALADFGDEQWVALLLDRVLTDGTGSRFQRASFDATGQHSEVVAEATYRTHSADGVRPTPSLRGQIPEAG